jgi:hypothetical protein
MCLLLGVEHHLLISPLSKLGIGIEERAVWRDLTLLGRVHWIWLLVGILVEGSSRVERLCVGIPSCLLLLDGVRIMVVLGGSNAGGRGGGIIRGRHALAGNRGVGRVCSR